MSSFTVTASIHHTTTQAVTIEAHETLGDSVTLVFSADAGLSTYRLTGRRSRIVRLLREAATAVDAVVLDEDKAARRRADLAHRSQERRALMAAAPEGTDLVALVLRAAGVAR